MTKCINIKLYKLYMSKIKLSLFVILSILVQLPALASEPCLPAPELKKEMTARLERFMQVGQEISARRLATRIGREETVLVDAIEGNTAIARSRGDAPEIDGIVRVTKGGHLVVGDFAKVRITGADAYDLKASPLKS